MAISAFGLFPIAPIEEQHAIADFLDHETAKIDALVARKERLIELLQEKRTALITRAVTRGLDPNAPMKDSGVEWLGEIPAHWEVRQWRYCCHVTEGQVAPDDEQFREKVLIAPNHIESGTGRILHMETANEQGAISGKYLVEPGDIIYSKIRPRSTRCVSQPAIGSAVRICIRSLSLRVVSKHGSYSISCSPSPSFNSWWTNP